METLDDVIDAMIADRVIHRHRRKWLIFFAILVALALLVFALGGWEEKKGRRVDTKSAPVTLEAGRFEFGITKATIIRRPKTKYSEAEAKLELSLDIRNIDKETRKSSTIQGELLRVVPPNGAPLIKADLTTCHGESGYHVVYGLPAVSCTTAFKVPPEFSEKVVEIAVLAEEYKPAEGSLISDDKPYWHNEKPIAVVQVPATIETEGDK
ncbi:hypothetical protein [Kribbella deserti]|uniref:DUF4352 domain-containing protein n=1 Tax=Kribbella deserti TaxID=1926257 RepID=A0ABV6QTR0_9ACTN